MAMIHGVNRRIPRAAGFGHYSGGSDLEKQRWSPRDVARIAQGSGSKGLKLTV
jgi:hypothetical protein